MPKLNANIIRAMVWDLKEMTTIVGEIMSWVGNVDCLSWRLPTQRCDTINISALLEHRSNSAIEYYLLLLELAYDRMHFILQLLIKFLEMFPLISKTFNLPANVTRPQFLSLGALLNMYWERILLLHKHLLQEEVSKCTSTISLKNNEMQLSTHTEVSHDISTRGSQTEICSLVECENCHLIEELVKLLVNHLETHGNNCGTSTAVTAERLQMKEAIFKVTQWSAMRNWVKAIIKDINTLITTSQELHIKSTSFNKTIQDEESKHQKEILKYKQIIKSLEENKKQMKMKIDNEVAKQQRAQNASKEMETKLKQQNMKIEEMKNELELTKNNIDKWKQDNIKLKSDINNLSEQVKHFKNEIDTKTLENQVLMEKLRISAECKVILENEIHDSKNLLEENKQLFILQLKTVQDTHAKECENFNKLNKNQCDEICALNEKILNLQSEKVVLQEMIDKQQNCVAELQEQLHTSEDKRMMLLAYPDLNGPLHQTKVQGNPFQDMQGQLEANMLRIQLLEQQNRRLQRTLNKMSTLSLLQEHEQQN